MPVPLLCLPLTVGCCLRRLRSGRLRRAVWPHRCMSVPHLPWPRLAMLRRRTPRTPALRKPSTPRASQPSWRACHSLLVAPRSCTPLACRRRSSALSLPLARRRRRPSRMCCFLAKRRSCTKRCRWARPRRTPRRTCSAHARLRLVQVASDPLTTANSPLSLCARLGLAHRVSLLLARPSGARQTLARFRTQARRTGAWRYRSS